MEPIPPKTEADTRHFLSRIAAREFDQETLASLLIAIRFYIPKKGLSREIADYVAHCVKGYGMIIARYDGLSIEVNPSSAVWPSAKIFSQGNPGSVSHRGQAWFLDLSCLQ